MGHARGVAVPQALVDVTKSNWLKGPEFVTYCEKRDCCVLTTGSSVFWPHGRAVMDRGLRRVIGSG